MFVPLFLQKNVIYQNCPYILMFCCGNFSLQYILNKQTIESSPVMQISKFVLSSNNSINSHGMLLCFQNIVVLHVTDKLVSQHPVNLITLSVFSLVVSRVWNIRMPSSKNYKMVHVNNKMTSDFVAKVAKIFNVRKELCS